MSPRLPRRLGERAASAAARARRRRPARPAVQGRMRNVIVLKPDDPRFTEAVFILRDDYLLSGELNRRELLLQAREAAENCLQTVLPARRRGLSPLLLPAAAALGALLYSLIF